MTLPKLNPLVVESLHSIGIERLYSFQEKILPKIKSGANFFLFADEGVGKTTAMIIFIVNKLNASALDDVPRVLIYVKDKAAAISLEEKFRNFTDNNDLRVVVAYEENAILKQRDEIYLGADIVIATPKRMSKLYYMNGINTGRINTIIIEDAEFLKGTDFHTDINRISESIERCQYLVFAKKMDSGIEKLKNLFMANAQVISDN